MLRSTIMVMFAPNLHAPTSHDVSSLSEAALWRMLAGALDGKLDEVRAYFRFVTSHLFFVLSPFVLFSQQQLRINAGPFYRLMNRSAYIVNDCPA
jgi:hypothetical protein